MSANTWLAIAVAGYSLAAVLLVASVILYFKLNILDVIGDLSGKTVARALKERQEKGTASKTGRRSGSVSKLMGGGAKTSSSGRKAAAQADKSAMSYAHQSKRLDKKATSGKIDARSGRTGKIAQRRGKTGTGSFAGAEFSHGSTDQLSVDTAVLAEGATDIISDYSTTAVLAANQTSVLIEETEKPERKSTEKLQDGGTAILQGGGTAILSEEPEEIPQGGTAVLSEAEAMPAVGATSVLQPQERELVRFTVTRSYLVTHTEEIIE